jgi:hypothetical protein
MWRVSRMKYGRIWTRLGSRVNVPKAHRRGHTTRRVVSGTRSVPDCSESFVEASTWLGGEGRDIQDAAERRAEALLAANRGLLRDFRVDATVARRSGEPGVLFKTSTRIGALPLLSPVTGRPDFGLVIEPRFAWSSAGEMLSGTGFRIVPELLPLPDLPQSERHVPPWVLSSIVLTRLRRLLDSLQRRFLMVEEDERAPRGSVQWGKYATLKVATGRMLDVPCRFPDLRGDEELRSVIHWVLRRHKDSLLSQSSAGIVVHKLIAICEALMSQLSDVQPRVPGPSLRSTWLRRPLSSRAFKEGLQAIEWTLDDRGLAGLSDLAGIAWRMDMDAFFEAWIEAIAAHVAERTGSSIRVGRREQTRVPLDWQPPTAGSQRSLLPDVVLERQDVALVIDAKYKRHAEQIERLGWHEVDEQMRDEHRNDVLQALAYSTLFNAPRIVACLAYPATPRSWEQLASRRRAVSRARVRAGTRHVEMALLAVPLSGDVEGPGREVARMLREAV